MILRDIDFGPVWGASGVQGFFGEGYWFHHLPLIRLSGLDFRGMTLTAKTTTLTPRPGKMPLTGQWAPQEWFPKSIVVNRKKNIALNAVSLSGPGAKALFESGRWQERGASFFVSYMSVSATRKERVEEAKKFVALFLKHLPTFRGKVGLQLNFSCPNTGHATPEWEAFLAEIAEILTIAAILGVPLVPKISVLMPPHLAAQMAAHPACDAVCVSNTIPWGELPEEIDWKGLFGSNTSPLAPLGVGGGGLSGAPLFPLVLRWVRKAEKFDFPKPICAGGGILATDDVKALAQFGVVHAVSLGSVAFLCPWRMRRLIQAAHRYITP